MANLPGAIRLNVTGSPLDESLQGSRSGDVNPMVGPPLDESFEGSRTGNVNSMVGPPLDDSLEGGKIGTFLGQDPPPIFYFRMRGIDSTCPAIQQPAYVYWTVEDEPDWLAAQLLASDLPCGSDPLTDVVDIQIAGRWVEYS